MSALPINASVRWYRAWWLWLVIAPPLAAVLGGIATMVLAVRGADGVVAADYYKRGLEINSSIARTQLAASLGLQAKIDAQALSSAQSSDWGGQIRLQLVAQQALPADAALKLQFVHPAHSDADRTVMLARTAIDAQGREAVYVGTLHEPLAQGVAWRITLSARDWRLQGDYRSDRADRANRANQADDKSQTELILQPEATQR